MYTYIDYIIIYIIILVIYYITKTEHMYPLKHSLGTALSPSLSSVHSYSTYMIGLTMEVEYSGGGVLIFSYLILMHERDTFGGLYDNYKLSRSSLLRVSSLAAALMAHQ